MNRTDLTLIIVSSIVIALVLGWSARWLFDRLNRAPHGADENGLDPIEAAKEAQKKAEAELKRIQLEYASEYNQLKAELAATMEGLHSARQRADLAESDLKALQSEEPPVAD
ncbi:MAG: hypothetical protein COB08_007440 [Rhodobacteraceae bacterium]|nr:hypothetical protein [Paracoccaceae bacterium]